MKVSDMKKVLDMYPDDYDLRFSVADDESEDDGERWFCEDGIESHFKHGEEVTICLVGRSNFT